MPVLVLSGEWWRGAGISQLGASVCLVGVGFAWGGHVVCRSCIIPGLSLVLMNGIVGHWVCSRKRCL